MGGTERVDRSMEDTQMRTLQGQETGHRPWQEQCHRGQGYSESSGRGEASQKLQGGKEEASREDAICALHRGELGFELGSAGPSPRALPTGHITLPWAM